jgi:tRNA dimethylallyltransferase
MQLIQLLGPTSSGKSDKAVDMALELMQNGGKVVIISCDSRQVYQDLNLSSGKIIGSLMPSEFISNMQTFYYRKVEHFFIDITTLDKIYTLTDFVEDFCELFPQLEMAGVNTVIMTGGTGLYARAVWEEYEISRLNQEDIPEFEEIKSALNTLILDELQSQLKQEDFNSSDWGNSRRLVNAILKNRFKAEGKLQASFIYPKFSSKKKYILEVDPVELQSRISQRVEERLEKGMLEEIENLYHKFGYERLYNLGLETRIGLLHILKAYSFEEMKEKMVQEIIKYAKRQQTWLSKEKEVDFLD